MTDQESSTLPTASRATSDRLAKLSWTERLGYGAGDAGFNFYWALIGGYLAAFYTDTLGLTAATAGAVILATKIIDAFTDPIMGAVADRTNTRFGKFRPYLIYASAPMAVVSVLAFTTPDLSYDQKVVWAFVTYSLMMVFYTILSTPYSSLSGVITGNVKERNLLISVRFIFAFGASALIGFFTPKLINLLGADNPTLGWQLTVAVYGFIAAIIFFITFKTTRERVAPPPQQKSNPLTDIKDLIHNRPWVILFFLALILMITITLRAGSSFYYFKYYVGREELVGPYLFWQSVALGVGCFMTPFLLRVFDKRTLLIILMSVVSVLSIAYYFVPKDMIWAMFTLNILISLALGPKSPLTWSMYADAADYNEWSTGRRATAMTFSAATFSQKLGSAAGSFAMLSILGYYGYKANEAQNGASLDGINFLQTALPGIFAAIAIVFVLFYKLNDQQLSRIQSDLAERADAQG
ncbi:MFS transporter [Arenicella xantha]|uniref:GPH family glycoside/pentoside/hexuronide:cation symporter n=1 Tax=Arenicella xantha TaxID=644221 RepID=A0A395JRI3_9GAMM|nr:MFS transporter [Arenicella xantha]RBP53175.1 GPH family glycoside/pentoside/hexuronide:cation symporter [Arenicella xantha]